MATRLKSLREEKGLSHERLSALLQEKYGIKISKDSLMNYEVSDPYHIKAGKNQGMRIEYLRCLADFYGVSSDYLLGLTTVKSIDPNMQQTTQYSSLSEGAISTIRALGNGTLPHSQLEKLNWLLSNQHFVFGITSSMDNLERAAGEFHKSGDLYNSWSEKHIQNFSNDEISLHFQKAEDDYIKSQDIADLSLYKANKVLTEVLDEFTKEFCHPMPDDIRKQEEDLLHGID